MNQNQLSIQKKLREDGLEKTVSDLKVIAKPKGELVLFKYNQIESDFSLVEVQQCRGTILDASDDWKVVNYPFQKFFNVQEGFADKLDWSKAKVLEKLDGSLMSLWNHNGEWRISSSGVIDAETASNDGLITFNELFKKALKFHYGLSFEDFTKKFDEDKCYSFELMTPENICVTQHRDYRLALIGVRNKTTMQEETVYDEKYSWLMRPKQYDLFNLEEIEKTFIGMDWQNEGYIAIVEELNRYGNFSRVKIKNPAYVACHFLKGTLASHHIMQVVKDNEIDEFSVYFKERAEEVKHLKEGYDVMTERLNNMYKINLNGGIGFESKKEYALRVQEIVLPKYQGLMYQFYYGKVKDAKEWMYEQDNRWLYETLIKNHERTVY